MDASFQIAESADEAQLLHSLAPKTSRKVWAEALLAMGGLRALVMSSDDALAEHLDAGSIRVLRSAFELTRRFSQLTNTQRRFTTPASLAEFLQPQLAHLPVERFVVMSLNSKNALLRFDVVAEGSVDQCSVDPRNVFRPALMSNASAIVIAHNHPSGDPHHSEQDLALTRQLVTVARSLCVKLVDHIIIGAGGKHTSMLSDGLISGR